MTSMHELLRNRLQDKEARCYFRQIIDAVGFCHRKLCLV